MSDKIKTSERCMHLGFGGSTLPASCSHSGMALLSDKMSDQRPTADRQDKDTSCVFCGRLHEFHLSYYFSSDDDCKDISVLYNVDSDRDDVSVLSKVGSDDRKLAFFESKMPSDICNKVMAGMEH